MAKNGVFGSKMPVFGGLGRYPLAPFADFGKKIIPDFGIPPTPPCADKI